MNIFAIDPDPILAADLPDKLVVKMVLESAQLLSTALRTTVLQEDFLYKTNHLNHPCSIWTRISRQNFEWLLWHAEGLAAQYNKRYKRRHTSQNVIDRCHEFVNRFPDTEQTSFALAMPDEFKSACPFDSYRRYLTSKPYFANGWKYSQRPQYIQWQGLE